MITDTHFDFSTIEMIICLSERQIKGKQPQTSGFFEVFPGERFDLRHTVAEVGLLSILKEKGKA